MGKLSDLGPPPLDTADPGRARELMLANLKSTLGLPLVPAQVGQALYYGATGQHARGESQVNDMADIINNWAYQGVTPPQNKTEMAVGMAPAIAATPGVIGKLVQAAPIAIQGIKDNATQLMAGLAQAGAAEAGVPYSVPQAPKLDQAAPIHASASTQQPLASPLPQLTPTMGVSQGADARIGLEDAGIPLQSPLEDAGVPIPHEDATAQSQDVIRTDQQVDKAPYDDSADYAARSEAVLFGLGTLALFAAGGVLGKLKGGVPDVAGDIAGTVQPKLAQKVVASTNDPNVGFMGPLGPATSAPTTVAGIIPVPPIISGPMRKAAQQLVDNKAALRAATDLLPEGTSKDNLIANINLTDAHGVDAKVNDFFKTARLPGSNLKTPVPYAEHVAKVTELPLDKQAAYQDLTALNSAIDQSIMEGYKPWGKGTKQLTYSDMLVKRSQIMTDHPEVVPLAEELHSIYKVFPQYMEQYGAIDAATRAKLELHNPNFSPRNEEFATTFLQSIMGDGRIAPANRTSTSFLDLDKRMDLTKEALPPGEVGRTLQLGEEYMRTVISALQTNKQRVDVAKALNGMTINGKKLMEIAYADARSGDTWSVPLYINGKQKWARVYDYNVYSAMMNRPRTVLPVISSLNKVAAWSITGPGNPLMALKYLGLDTTLAPMMLPKGTDLGPVSGMLRALGVKRGLSSFDPSNLVAVPAGTVRGLWGDATYAFHTALKEGLRNNSPIVQWMGDKNVETLSQMMADAFERSTASLAERTGAIGGDRFSVIDDSKTTSEVLSQFPGFRGITSSMTNMGGFKQYLSVMDAMREGARLQFMATNVPRKLVMRDYQFQWGKGPGLKTYTLPMPTWEVPGDFDPTKVAGQTRRLLGDTTEIGGDTTTRTGRGSQYASSAILWGNQSLQVAAQAVRIARDNPVRFAGTLAALTSSGIAAWSYALSQPDVAKQLEGMTPEQRSRVIPVAFNNKLLMMLNVDQMLRPVFGSALHAWLGLTGHLAHGEWEGMGDAAHVFAKSFTDDFLPNFTGPMPIIAAGMNKHLDANSLQARDPQTNIIDNLNDPYYMRTVGEWGQNFMDSVGGTTITAAINGLQAGMAAHLHNLGVKNPLNYINPIQAAANQFAGPLQEAKQTGPMTWLWGQGISASVSNNTYEKVQRNTLPALAAIKKLGDSSIMHPDRVLGGTNVAQAGAGVVADNRGTEFAHTIYPAAKAMIDKLIPMRQEYSILSAQKAKVEIDPIYNDPKVKRSVLNNIVKQQADLNEKMLTAIRSKEAEVGKVIPGFTFDNWQESVR